MSQGFATGDPRAKAAGKRGGRVSGEARQAKRSKRWEQCGLDPQTAATIYRQGYMAGYAMGRKAKAIPG